MSLSRSLQLGDDVEFLRSFDFEALSMLAVARTHADEAQDGDEGHTAADEP